MVARTVLSTLMLGALAAPAAMPSSDSARTFLATAFNVTQSDLGRIDAGHVLSRTLPVRHSREVATLGIVRMKTTPKFYVERLTDIATFKRDEAILQIGTFSDPPQLDDVAGLTLDDADVRRLRDCRVADCSVQLSAEAIERFRSGVDWRAADVRERASSLMRQILVEYVTRYRQVGTPATMEYADGPIRLNQGQEFLGLVAADTTTWPYIPGMRQHLIEYPAVDTDGTIDIVYWSKERVNRRPVISITHLAIVPTRDSPADYAIASKQIYGMHYFDASLGLTLLVRDGTASAPASYVVYLNRSRIDLFDGVFGGIARRLVSRKARTVVSEQLAQLQRTLEPQFVASEPDCCPRPASGR